LNGGGKSTLLQLIFILLHCSADPEKHEFIHNLLEGFTIPDGSDKRVVANFEIWDGEKIIHLEYFVFLRSAFWNLSKTFENDEELENKFYREKRIAYIFEYKCRRMQSPIEISRKYQVLFCQLTGIEFEEIDQFLVNLSKRIFLGSPSTQIFLFLSNKYRKSLFKSPSFIERISDLKAPQELNEEWEKAKKELTNFFSYDFISVDVLIRSFKRARDKDFEEAIETGDYGNHYQNLLNDFNEFLKDKKVNLDKNLSGVNFKAERNGEIIELYPEDLSHGELKRLSLYVWLKYSNRFYRTCLAKNKKSMARLMIQ
jgi:hypothetical protein